MLELGGYNHFTFFQEDPPFYLSTYFELITLIREKDDKERKEYNKIDKGSKRKR